MKRTSPLIALALAAILPLAALSACGDDDDESADSVAVADTPEAGAGAVTDPSGPTSVAAVPTSAVSSTAPESAADTSASTDPTEAPDTTGGTSEPDTPTTSGEPLPVCTPLEVIGDYDAQSQEIMASGDSYSAIRDFLVDASEEITAAYDSVADLEPELAADAVALRDFTKVATDAAVEAEDIEGLAGALQNAAGVDRVITAAQRLNKFALDRCGITMGG